MEKRAHVIGLGRSGIAAAKLLRQAGWTVVLSDRNAQPLMQEIIPALVTAGIPVSLDHSLSVE